MRWHNCAHPDRVGSAVAGALTQMQPATQLGVGALLPERDGRAQNNDAVSEKLLIHPSAGLGCTKSMLHFGRGEICGLGCHPLGCQVKHCVSLLCSAHKKQVRCATVHCSGLPQGTT
jgi:hypothetical protein